MQGVCQGSQVSLDEDWQEKKITLCLSSFFLCYHILKPLIMEENYKLVYRPQRESPAVSCFFASYPIYLVRFSFYFDLKNIIFVLQFHQAPNSLAAFLPRFHSLLISKIFISQPPHKNIGQEKNY